PITQQLKQLRRQHGVAVFASFALLNPQQHALGVAVRLLGEAAHRHVFDHARTQRADGPGRRSGGHRGGPLRAEGCWTFDARDWMPRSSPLTAHPPTATAKNAPASTPPSRESGFVLCPHCGCCLQLVTRSSVGGDLPFPI